MTESTKPEDVDVMALGMAMRVLNAGGHEVQLVATPFTAYTVVAACQGMIRNPALSDFQRQIVQEFARQLADQLYVVAADLFGQPNIIAGSLEMGFDPRHDRPAGFMPQPEIERRARIKARRLAMKQLLDAVRLLRTGRRSRLALTRLWEALDAVNQLDVRAAVEGVTAAEQAHNVDAPREGAPRVNSPQ